MKLEARQIEFALRSGVDYGAAIAAWTYSRPKEGDITYTDIAAIDAPINEFPTFTVEMTVPILLREWITTFRDHTIWARTSRADDIDVWPIWEPLYADDHSYRLFLFHYRRMQEQKAAGAAQDEYRMNIPLGYMTSMSARMSFRSLVKMYLAALAESRETQGLVSRMFRVLADKIALEAYRGSFGDLFDAAAAKYTTDRLFDYGWTLSGPTIAPVSVGSFVFVNLSHIPLALRAQLVRHRALLMQDNLFRFFNDNGFLAAIRDPMDVSIVCTRQTALSLITKRNCWIAQEDLWVPVISALNTAINPIGDKVAVPLPCDHGPCPFARDNELRMAGKDKAPVCPRYLDIQDDRLPTTAESEAMREYIGRHKPTTAKIWTRML